MADVYLSRLSGAATADFDDSGLANSEEDFQRIFENAPIGIYQSTFSELLRVNTTLARLLGYEDAGEVLANCNPPERIFVQPEQRLRLIAAAEASPGYVMQEVDYRRKDGSVFTSNLRMRAVRDAAGKTRMFEGFVENITERKQLEEQLRQAQKIEEIGRLAGGVAHDFNNISAAILMHLGLMRQNSSLTPGMKDVVKEIENEAMRAANLTRQLMLFSRRQLARTGPLDLNAVIQNILKMLRRLLGEDIDVEFQQALPAAWVQADAGMMEQVVVNLCNNARDAMPRGGNITVKTELVERPDGSNGGRSGAEPSFYVCLTVSDAGCGMDAKVLLQVFEPFFTTKEVGKGTGLGLATVYGIVKQHAGWVEVESEVGVGSTFRVFLPALTAPPAQISVAQDAPDHVRGGAETILLVEDEVMLRRAAALSLRKLGYGVFEADCGAQALEVWRERRGHVDLLLTDMVMPGRMTGLELANELCVLKPELRVIISSGYLGDVADPREFGAQVIFLEKPYRLRTLAAAVRQGLDATGAEDATADEPTIGVSK